jgi:hypothetical protein
MIKIAKELACISRKVLDCIDPEDSGSKLF